MLQNVKKYVVQTYNYPGVFESKALGGPGDPLIKGLIAKRKFTTLKEFDTLEEARKYSVGMEYDREAKKLVKQTYKKPPFKSGQAWRYISTNIFIRFVFDDKEPIVIE